ncbi:MAG: phospho-N-acetylmuramoyl-pentapeptide-transferase [Clostridia bacterium]|nr:phospho-N-acetylmuramoyl-pentapeptide-transferase [Clostridia bacterium]
MIAKLIFTFLTAFFACIILMPKIIAFTRKLKLRQTILHYVDNHQAKSGTPTMGGIGFILAIAISALTFCECSERTSMLMLVLVTVGYGAVGFLDDFIKVFFKRNEGLSPLQKIIFQLIIAIIVSLYAYNSPLIGDKLYIPVTNKIINLGKFSIPLYIVVFLAFTNSVNLSDGLDGLASSVSAIYSLVFAVIIGITALVTYGNFFDKGSINFIIYCVAMAGSLYGFLLYNGFPAKIFMGDTGSLALGGGLAALAIMSSQVLSVLIVGIMYVLTALSVIIQVAYYKKTKKRVFLMAPLHHHFERKGVHENKIVAYYSAVTLIVGIVTIGTSLIYNF